MFDDICSPPPRIAPALAPETHFTKGALAHTWHLSNFSLPFIIILIIQPGKNDYVATA